VSDRVPDGTPDIDDADTAFQQAFSIIAQMMVHPFDTGFIGLIDVDTLLLPKISSC
jgi:hypothetical protein